MLNRLRFGSSAGSNNVVRTVSERSNERLVQDNTVVGGNLDTCVRLFERWVATGLDQMVSMSGAGHTNYDQVMRALDPLREEVMPKFR